jgi:hypothetical protein
VRFISRKFASWLCLNMILLCRYLLDTLLLW